MDTFSDAMFVFIVSCLEQDGIAGESEAGKSECFVEHCFWFVFNFNRTQRGLLLNQNDLTLKI